MTDSALEPFSGQRIQVPKSVFWEKLFKEEISEVFKELQILD
jgi:hypothetical protein